MKPLVLSVAALIPARLRRAPSGESRRRTCRSGLRRCLARKSYSSLDLHTVRLNVGASRSCDVDISGPLCDEIGWTHRIAVEPRPSSWICVGVRAGQGSFYFRDPTTQSRVSCFIQVCAASSNRQPTRDAHHQIVPCRWWASAGRRGREAISARRSCSLNPGEC